MLNKASLLDGGEETIFATVQRLQATHWGEREINERIGRFYHKFLTSGTLPTTLNYAIKLLMDPNSRYAISPEGQTTAWNFVSAMTQYSSGKTTSRTGRLPPGSSSGSANPIAYGHPARVPVRFFSTTTCMGRDAVAKSCLKRARERIEHLPGVAVAIDPKKLEI